MNIVNCHWYKLMVLTMPWCPDLESRPQPSRLRTWPPRPPRPRPRTWSSRPSPRPGQVQGLGLQGQGQGRCQGQCQYGSLFSQNFKTQTFIAGRVMTNFILIARFSKLVIKLTVSFSQRTLKYFRPSTCFPRPRTRRPRPRTWPPRPRTWPVVLEAKAMALRTPSLVMSVCKL